MAFAVDVGVIEEERQRARDRFAFRPALSFGRMRVALHVGQLLQPVPGGIGRYVDGLLGTLPDVDVDVVSFAAGPPPPGRPSPLPEYVDLGRFNCGIDCGAAGPDNVSMHDNIVRAGVNYHFGWGK